MCGSSSRIVSASHTSARRGRRRWNSEISCSGVRSLGKGGFGIIAPSSEHLARAARARPARPAAPGPRGPREAASGSASACARSRSARNRWKRSGPSSVKSEVRCSRWSTSSSGNWRVRISSRSRYHASLTSPRSRFWSRIIIWRKRSTISGWWLTANMRGMTPFASRANSIIVTASPGSPPTPRVSKASGDGAGREAVAAVGIRSNRRFSTTRSRALGPTSSAKRRNQGCSAAGQRQDVLEHAAALALLRPAQHRRGRARPAAEHAEGVADGDERRLRRGA